MVSVALDGTVRIYCSDFWRELVHYGFIICSVLYTCSTRSVLIKNTCVDNMTELKLPVSELDVIRYTEV